MSHRVEISRNHKMLYLNSEISLNRYLVASMFVLLSFFPHAIDLLSGMEPPHLLAPTSLPLYHPFHRASRRFLLGKLYLQSLMDGDQRMEASGHLCHYNPKSPVPCVIDMWCPVLNEKKISCFNSTCGFTPYLPLLPPRAWSCVQPGVSRSGKGAGPQEKSYW